MPKFIKLGENYLPEDINFLIIDDMENIRELLISSLEDIGFEGSFHEAEGLRESQKVFNDDNINIDYILLDWTLEDGDGLQFIQALRKLDEYNNVPILLITGNDDIGDLLHALEEGASNYLIKPWKHEELEDKISFCWKKHN